MGTVTRLKPQAAHAQRRAAILPRLSNGGGNVVGLIAVVESPAGLWMVLAGSWRFAPVAREFLERHGYLIISPSVAQAAIDQQSNGP